MQAPKQVYKKVVPLLSNVPFVGGGDLGELPVDPDCEKEDDREPKKKKPTPTSSENSVVVAMQPCPEQ